MKKVKCIDRIAFVKPSKIRHHQLLLNLLRVVMVAKSRGQQWPQNNRKHI